MKKKTATPETGREKILYLFRGPCGSGKTFIREQMKKMPCVGIDMGDPALRTLSIEERVRYPAAFVWKPTLDTVTHGVPSEVRFAIR